MSNPLRGLGRFGLLIGVLNLLAFTASGVEYKFTKIAETSDAIAELGDPKINSKGEVVFKIIYRGNEPSGIYISDGSSSPKLLYPYTKEFPGFFMSDVNESGSIVFTMGYSGEKTSIYKTSPGGKPTLIVSAEDKDAPLSGVRPVINNDGLVAWHGIFVAYLQPATGAGRIAVDKTEAPRSFPTLIPEIKGVQLNNSGTIATRIANVKTPSRVGQYTKRAGAALVLETGQNVQFAGGISDDGDVILVMEDIPNNKIYLARQGKLKLVMSSGAISALTAVQNNKGQFAFNGNLAWPDNRSGIYTGPDPVRDKVIAAGDMLFGSKLEGLGVSLSRGINDAGQIMFSYNNGVNYGIAIATPIR